jgi:type I restriction enzyme M protein
LHPPKFHRYPPTQSGEEGACNAPYEDVAGFCASVPIARVAELDYVLTPGRYVGLPEEEEDFNFADRFAALKAEFEAQLQEEEALNRAIADNLSRIQL